MLAGKTILAVVPARGGSKGIPRKNLQPLAGKPLVQWTAELLAGLAWIDRSVVSTDDEEIAGVCEAHGLAAPFRRPEELSGDRISDLQVLTHALATLEEQDGTRYDVVLLLHPTTPLRTREHVEALARTLLERGDDAVWAVSPADLKYHPLKALTLSQGPEGRLAHFDPRGAGIIARQQLEPVYYRNGAGYAFTRRCFTELQSILPERSSALVIEDPMVSIDTREDMDFAEGVLERPGA